MQDLIGGILGGCGDRLQLSELIGQGASGQVYRGAYFVCVHVCASLYVHVCTCVCVCMCVRARYFVIALKQGCFGTDGVADGLRYAYIMSTIVL